MDIEAIASLCHSYSNKIGVLRGSQEERVGEAAIVTAQALGALTPLKNCIPDKEVSAPSLEAPPADC